MKSCLAMSLLFRPCATRRSTSSSRSVSRNVETGLAVGLRHLLELVDQLDRHRRADQRLAVGHDADRLRDLLDRGVLEQVAGGAALDGLVEVGLLVGDREHEDLGGRHGLLDRHAGLDAGDASASGRRAGPRRARRGSASSMPVGAVAGLAHHLEAGLGAMQHRQPAPEQLLVVDDDDPDRLRTAACGE